MAAELEYVCYEERHILVVSTVIDAIISDKTMINPDGLDSLKCQLPNLKIIERVVDELPKDLAVFYTFSR